MIIFLDGQGRLVNKKQEDINQGSNLANIIYLVAPIPNTTQVLAYFTLPNSAVTKPRYVIAETSSPDIIKLGNENYNVWSLKLDAPITAYYGQASVTFCFISGEEKLNSDLINFNISKGIAVKLPEDLSQIKALDDILTLVSDVYGTNENLYNQVQDIDTQVKEIDNQVRALETIAGVLDSGKQDKLTAGDGITIDNKVIKVNADSELNESTNPVQNKVVKETIERVEGTANTAYNMAGQNQWEIAEIHTRIDTLHANAFVIVDSLPEPTEEHLGKIYLVSANNGNDNFYDEYIVIKAESFSWEKIGSTSLSQNIDLSDYVKNTDYATNAKVGIIKGGSSANSAIFLNTSTGYGEYAQYTLFINSANEANIKARKPAFAGNGVGVIAPDNMDIALRIALTESILTYTDEEKTKVSELLGFLMKTASQGNQVYVSQNGVNRTISYSTQAQASTIACRGTKGELKVGTPTEDTHATTKEYVDNATKLYLHDVTISCYTGTVNFKMINKKSTSFVLDAHSFDLPIISDIIATPYDGERTIAYDFIFQGEDQGGTWVEMFYARREDGSAIVLGPTDDSFGIIDNIKTL